MFCEGNVSSSSVVKLTIFITQDNEVVLKTGPILPSEVRNTLPIIAKYIYRQNTTEQNDFLIDTSIQRDVFTRYIKGIPYSKGVLRQENNDHEW